MDWLVNLVSVMERIWMLSECRRCLISERLQRTPQELTVPSVKSIYRGRGGKDRRRLGPEKDAKDFRLRKTWEAREIADITLCLRSGKRAIRVRVRVLRNCSTEMGVSSGLCSEGGVSMRTGLGGAAWDGEEGLSRLLGQSKE